MQETRLQCEISSLGDRAKWSWAIFERCFEAMALVADTACISDVASCKSTSVHKTRP